MLHLFDTREGIDYFSMGVHVPGFLKWGDISLAAALSGSDIEFINPVTMSGHRVNGDKLSSVEAEFEKIGMICGSEGKTVFK
jgi:hypothetical protein